MSKNITISDTVAEAGIIATLIYNPSYYLHSEQLKQGHFFNKDSACIYWGISQLVEQGVENIDSFNLTTIINSNEGIKNTFDKFGIDIDGYINLSKSICRETVEEYKILVNRVLALAFKRELHKQLKKFDDQCLDVEQDDVAKLSDNIYGVLNNLNQSYIIHEDIKMIGEVIDDIWDEICSRRQNGSVGFLPVIPSLSQYFTYEKTEAILISARMKQGKSSYGMIETLHKMEQGIPCAYFDTEMNSRQWIERALAHITQIPVRKIKNGNYTASEEEQLKEALGWIRKQKFVHIYKPKWTNESIYNTAKIIQNKIGLEFLCFDYIKESDGNASEVANKIAERVDTLKNTVAGKLDIAVLMFAQLNRNMDVAESDKIERIASVSVRWIKKDDSEIVGDWRNTGNYKMHVKYNRLGSQMDDDEKIDIVFIGDTMQIYEASIQSPKESAGI